MNTIKERYNNNINVRQLTDFRLNLFNTIFIKLYFNKEILKMLQSFFPTGMIKKFLFVIIFVFSYTSSVYAEWEEKKVNKDWTSGIIVDEEFSFPRMLTEDSSTKSALIFDFIPKPNKGVECKIRVFFEGKNDSLSGKELTGAIRVDEKNIYDVKIIIGSIASVFFDIITDKESEIIKDCIEGNLLRIQYNFEGEKKYCKFSLSGFTAAFKRTLIFINMMEKMLPSDNEYFFKKK